MGWTAIMVALAFGYVLGRVRPLQFIFAPPAEIDDDPHIRIVPDKDGKPIRTFVP